MKFSKIFFFNLFCDHSWSTSFFLNLAIPTNSDFIIHLCRPISGCKDIGNKEFEFVATTQFLSVVFEDVDNGRPHLEYDKKFKN